MGAWRIWATPRMLVILVAAFWIAGYEPASSLFRLFLNSDKEAVSCHSQLYKWQMDR